MSVRRLAEVQPPFFAFTPENTAWADTQISKYPEGRQASAVLSLLWRAQKQHDYWLPKPAIEEVARMLGMPYIRVLEVATFYSMFNLEPVGRYFIQLCGTTPCMLRGSDGIKSVLERKVGAMRKVRADGMFCWLEVECLGACCNAPMVQINDDYYEDLTPENFERLLDDLEAGRSVTVGSQTGRRTSEPAGGLTSLTAFYGVDGQARPNTDQFRLVENTSPHPASMPQVRATEDEGTTIEAAPDRPAMSRRDQRQVHSAGVPDYARDMGPNDLTSGERTKVGVSDAQRQHEAAQAAANGGAVHTPATKPGHEPGKEGSAPGNDNEPGEGKEKV